MNVKLKWPKFKGSKGCLPKYLEKSPLMSENEKAVCSYFFLMLENYDYVVDTNNELAVRFCCHPRTMSKYVNRLKELGIIEVYFDSNENNRRYISKRTGYDKGSMEEFTDNFSDEEDDKFDFIGSFSRLFRDLKVVSNRAKQSKRA